MEWWNSGIMGKTTRGKKTKSKTISFSHFFTNIALLRRSKKQKDQNTGALE